MAATEVRSAMAKVTISNLWHLPLHLVKKESEEQNEDLKATAVVRVKAPLEVTKHFPIHLIVLIDVSCPREAADPSRLDLLKNALKFIMRHLHDRDRLTIVYANNEREELEISGGTQKNIEDENIKDKYIEDKVNSLSDKLNVSATSKPRLDEAKKIFTEDKLKNQSCFIVLLSDGLTKSKFKCSYEWSYDKSIDANKTALRQSLKGYPAVHTFGLYKDHDPSALMFIAEESKGTYSSITENVSSTLIEALAVCLCGLTNIVAVNTEIKIEAGNQRPGGTTTTITEVKDHGSLSFRKVNASSCTIPIGILYAGEVKDLLVQFQVKIGYFKQGSSNYKPLSAKGSYKVPGGSSSESIEPCAPAFSVYARRILTPGNEQALLSFPVVNQHEVRNSVLCLVAELQKDYQELKMEAGKSGNSAGGKLALENIVGTRLMKKWEGFKKSDSIWKNAEEVGLDVERIENDIDEMVSGLKLGLGMGCVYSWVLSNQNQRAATTGLPTTAFLTPKMKEMVLEARKKFKKETSSSAARNTVPPAVPPGFSKRRTM